MEWKMWEHFWSELAWGMLTSNKIGRNERCQSGSGKKYKHCHGWIASEPARQTLPAGLAPQRAQSAAARVTIRHRPEIPDSSWREPLTSARAEPSRVSLAVLILHDRLRKIVADFQGGRPQSNT